MFLGWYEDGLRGIAPQMPAPGYKWRETPKLNRAIWEKHRSRSQAAVRADLGFRIPSDCPNRGVPVDWATA